MVVEVPWSDKTDKQRYLFRSRNPRKTRGDHPDHCGRIVESAQEFEVKLSCYGSGITVVQFVELYRRQLKDLFIQVLYDKNHLSVYQLHVFLS